MSFNKRTEIARLMTGRCTNCFERLPGEIGCSVRSPGWHWVTPNLGPFCDACFGELAHTRVSADHGEQ